MGLLARRAASNASSPQGNQSTAGGGGDAREQAAALRSGRVRWRLCSARRQLRTGRPRRARVVAVLLQVGRCLARQPVVSAARAGRRRGARHVAAAAAAAARAVSGRGGDSKTLSRVATLPAREGAQQRGRGGGARGKRRRTRYLRHHGRDAAPHACAPPNQTKRLCTSTTRPPACAAVFIEGKVDRLCVARPSAPLARSCAAARGRAEHSITAHTSPSPLFVCQSAVQSGASRERSATSRTRPNSSSPQRVPLSARPPAAPEPAGARECVRRLFRVVPSRALAALSQQPAAGRSHGGRRHEPCDGRRAPRHRRLPDGRLRLDGRRDLPWHHPPAGAQHRLRASRPGRWPPLPPPRRARAAAGRCRGCSPRAACTSSDRDQPAIVLVAHPRLRQ